jgi:hypothetical protein
MHYRRRLHLREADVLQIAQMEAKKDEEVIADLLNQISKPNLRSHYKMAPLFASGLGCVVRQVRERGVCAECQFGWLAHTAHGSA